MFGNLSSGDTIRNPEISVMSPNFGARPMLDFVPGAQALDLSEMVVAGDQGRACLQAMSGDPDVVDRNRGSVFPALFGLSATFPLLSALTLI